MTMTVPPWDLYREIHKAMRHALFGVTSLAGQTDAADAHAVRGLHDEWQRVAFVLAGHHEHEDRFCDPLIVRHAPWLRDEVEAAHRRSESSLAHLHRSVERLVQSSAPESGSLLRTLYLDLADFTAVYMGHLRDEEDRVMPALNAALGNDELCAVTAAIRGSVAPDAMCTYIRYMLPSMNFAERLEMLSGMHAGAPPQVFEMFRKAAQATLSAQQYGAVAAAAGFA